MEKVLELVFSYANGKKKTLTVKSPKDGISDSDCRKAMQAVIDSNVFVSDDNGALAAIAQAQYKTTDTEVIIAAEE